MLSCRVYYVQKLMKHIHFTYLVRCLAIGPIHLFISIAWLVGYPMSNYFHFIYFCVEKERHDDDAIVASFDLHNIQNFDVMDIRLPSPQIQHPRVSVCLFIPKAL